MRARCTVLLSLCSLAIVLAMRPQEAGGGEPPGRHAVLIGINDYKDKSIPDLKCAEADARAVHKVLTDPKIGMFPPENVELILGKQATPVNIKKALGALRTVGKDGLVVVFFSGHGAKELGEAFWVTQQAELGDLTATALSDVDIGRLLRRIPSERLVSLVDCCYAAATVKDRKAVLSTSGLWKQFTGKGRVVISGAGDSEEALEMPDVGLGVFTHFLVQGLSGKADGNEDGVVTLAEAYTYLSESVETEARKRRGLQKASFHGETSGQFLLSLNPGVREADEGRLRKLRDMLAANGITTKHYEEAKELLSAAITPPASSRVRQVYVDLADGKIGPKYLAGALDQARSSRPDGISGKPTLAVVDFQVIGDIGEPEAGKALAELLIPHFAEDYELIERRQLTKLLEEDDLSMTDLVGARAVPTKAVKLRQVEYLVIGSVVKFVDFNVNARLVRWQTGQTPKTASVSADDIAGLKRAIPSLAKDLLMYRTGPVGPKELEVDLGGGVTMSLVLVRPGTFSMGSPGSDKHRAADETAHEVEITKPFYLGVAEVTQAQWKAVMGTEPWTGKREAKSDPQRPATYISWEDCREFIRKLNGKVKGGEFRLPTEAEWEYACRAGSKTRFHYGDDLHFSELDRYAWYAGNTSRLESGPGVVREKLPNAWGLYDMHGKVWEWCADGYGEYPKWKVTDPTGPKTSPYRVVRGGSFRPFVWECRAASRRAVPPTRRVCATGFRCARTVRAR